MEIVLHTELLGIEEENRINREEEKRKSGNHERDDLKDGQEDK